MANWKPPLVQPLHTQDARGDAGQVRVSFYDNFSLPIRGENCATRDNEGRQSGCLCLGSALAPSVKWVRGGRFECCRESPCSKNNNTPSNRIFRVESESVWYQAGFWSKDLAALFDAFAFNWFIVWIESFLVSPSPPPSPPSQPRRWVHADAEINSSVENPELKGSPFKAWNKSECGHACFTYCQGISSLN